MAPTGRRKGRSTPSPLKGREFEGDGELTYEDWKKLTVPSTTDAPRRMYSDWPGKLVGYCAATLANDNCSVLNMTFNLAGSLWERGHSINASRFFDEIEQGTTLYFPTFNSSALCFNQGNLVSDFLSHEQIGHEWKQNGQPHPPPPPNKPFCIRAFVAPVEAKWARLWLVIYPVGKAELLAKHKLATNKAFPGLELYAATFPLGFSTEEILPNLNWGVPIVPAVVTGTEWQQRPSHPSTAGLKRAISATLRTAARPEIKKDKTHLLARWNELNEGGEAVLKSTMPAEIWPECDSDTDNRGEITLTLSQFA